MERIGNNMIAKKIYVRECAGSCSVGQLRKRCIDVVKDKQEEWCVRGVNEGGWSGGMLEV